MKYADSEYYFLNYEDDSIDNDAAATHIGMYLAWLVLHEMVAAWHLEQHGDALRALKARATTPGNFALDLLDGQLHDGDMSPLGDSFSAWYFPETYHIEYADLFGVSLDVNVDFCSVPDTWENFERLAPLIDARFEQWQALYDAKNRTQLSSDGTPWCSPSSL
jgi:hypothetical protein